jgi:hypothetical protein
MPAGIFNPFSWAHQQKESRIMFLVEQRTTCEEEFVTGSTNKQQNIDGDGGFPWKAVKNLGLLSRDEEEEYRGTSVSVNMV